MHCHGWRSVYCNPRRPGFKGSTHINLSNRLHKILQQASGSIEIFLSRHCPIWYGYGCGLKPLKRFAYINSVVNPFTSIPLITYCTLPAICLFTGKFIVPKINNYARIVFMALFISIAATNILEMQWGRVTLDDWWRNEQFWLINGVSSHFFVLFQGLLKALTGVDANITVASKDGDNGKSLEIHLFKWTSLLIPPMTLLIIIVIGVIVRAAGAVNNGYDTWGLLFAKFFFALWVILHLYPFLKGMMGERAGVPIYDCCVPPRPMDAKKDLEHYMGMVQLRGKTEWKRGRKGRMEAVLVSHRSTCRGQSAQNPGIPFPDYDQEREYKEFKV